MAVGLSAPRAVLYRALDARVDRMLSDGLLDEVGALLAAGFAPTLPSMQGIGYRHLAPAVRERGRLEAGVTAMKRDTRRYAKRQLTWFAREPEVTWIEIDPADVTAALHQIKKTLEHSRLFD
jgi:tRNA dimethylallyltransferase